MQARQRTFTTSSGLQLDLPLLVPAFSSKGFKLWNAQSRPGHYSEVAYPFNEFTKHPVPACLISGYDVHFRHFDAPDVPALDPASHLANTAVVFVDSGGYELADEFDTTEPRIYPLPAKDFTEADYLTVLECIEGSSPTPPLIVANFDRDTRNQPLGDQIRAARSIFERFPALSSDFIIKPWTPGGEVVNPAAMSPDDFASLRGFDVIGVTEKELGKNLIDRLRRTAALRVGLDRAEVAAPIHIWGGLDPVMSPLFFFAGAEIFDGVSWLRYAYVDGVAVCRESFGPLMPDLGVATGRSVNDLTANLRNVTTLSNLRDALIEWCLYDGERFDMFEDRVRPVFETAYRKMTARIRDLRGQ